MSENNELSDKIDDPDSNGYSEEEKERDDMNEKKNLKRKKF